MNAGMREKATTLGPWVVAGALWAASVAMCFFAVPSAVHGLVDVTASTVTICAFIGRRRPGRVEEDLRCAERMMVAAIAETYAESRRGDPEPQPRALRSV